MLRCLIVEDDELSRELLALQMEPYAQCDLAENGREGLDRFTAALKGVNRITEPAGYCMPGDGWFEAARRSLAMNKNRVSAKKRGADCGAVNTSTPQDVIQAYVAAQSAAHLVKPVQPEKLVKTLRKLELIPTENA